MLLFWWNTTPFHFAYCPDFRRIYSVFFRNVFFLCIFLIGSATGYIVDWFCASDNTLFIYDFNAYRFFGYRNNICIVEKANLFVR